VQLAVTALGAIPEESATCAVKLNTPLALGVPVIAPVLPLRINPVDKLPVLEKV